MAYILKILVWFRFTRSVGWFVCVCGGGGVSVSIEYCLSVFHKHGHSLGHIMSAECEPFTGVWRQSPCGVHGFNWLRPWSWKLFCICTTSAVEQFVLKSALQNQKFRLTFGGRAPPPARGPASAVFGYMGHYCVVQINKLMKWLDLHCFNNLKNTAVHILPLPLTLTDKIDDRPFDLFFCIMPNVLVSLKLITHYITSRVLAARWCTCTHWPVPYGQ